MTRHRSRDESGRRAALPHGNLRLIRQWLRHEDALAAAVAHEFGQPEPSDEVRVYVQFALQIQLLASDSADPDAMLSTGFRVLEQGWDAYAEQVAASAVRR